jgi:hypothetical protein
LKTNQPLPLGKRVKCPKCGAHFSVGADNLSAAPAPLGVDAAPERSAPPADFSNGDITARSPAPSPVFAAPMSRPFDAGEFAPPPKSNVGLLVAILAGGVLFLAGGIALAIICFSGIGSESESQQSADDDDRAADRSKSTIRKPLPEKKKPETEDKKHSDDKSSGGNVAKKAEKPAPAYLPNAEQKRVNEAIDRGAKYLQSLQKENGAWEDPESQIKNFAIGLTAFVGLTLLECGIPAQDPGLQKAAEFIRSQEAPERGSRIQLTYDVSLAILFLDRLGAPADQKLIQQLALRLVANQKSSGGWSYVCEFVPSPAEQDQLLSLLRKNQQNMSKLVDPLDLSAVDPAKLQIEGGGPPPDSLKKLAVWRKDIDPNANPQRLVEESDNSNTQFAVLALWAAKKHNDLPLQRTLALIVKRFRQGQNNDGSWGYLLNGREMAVGAKFPTMTCAGLLGLAVGLGLANENKAKEDQPRTAAHLDPKVKKGLDVVAHFVANPSPKWDPKAKLIDLYFLWSVERVAVIYGLRKLDDKDWYGWGAEKIIASQTAKGGWENGGYSHSVPTADTCFALLFLKRANLAKDLTSKLQLGD